jgi:hypothetical protein
VANTGAFLFLVNAPVNAVRVQKLFEDLVEEKSPTLRNLEWQIATQQGSWGILGGYLDNVRPNTVREFLESNGLNKGVRAFVVDSVYGDEWEEVINE